MLPLPNLDDQEFADILDHSIRMIPRISPKWTDINFHDPGVTFIELFAWLKEMQQYYMNQTTDKNRSKFLELLGVELSHGSPAKLNVGLKIKKEKCFLPKGHKFWINEVCFENDESVFLKQRTIKSVILINEFEIKDISHIYRDPDTVFQPFGKVGTKEGQIYMGIDDCFDVNEKESLFFRIDKENREAMEESIHLEDLGNILWEYYGEEKGVQGWHLLKIDRDETCSFLQSGNIRFHVDGHMKKSTILNLINEEHYWIRGTLKESYYEVMPKVRNIYFNGTSLTQKDSYCDYIEIHHRDIDITNSNLRLEHFLGLYENIKACIQNDRNQWEDITDEFIEQIISVKNQTYLIIKDKFIKEWKGSIRLIFYKDDFDQGMIGEGRGIPNQEIKLKNKNVYYEHFRLQVGIHTERNKVLWEDWEKVRSLDKSDAYKRHYVLDEEEGIIRFGDNEHGLIPPKDGEIRVIAYSTSLGSHGNIKEVFIEDKEELEDISISTGEVVRKGKDKETLQTGIIRLKRELGEINRGVTSKDYEEIVMNMPGLKIARVKALPLYKPGMREYPIEKSKNCITLVVVPYSERKMPLLNDVYIKNIKKYIDQFRLITTDVYVMSPEYIGINIYGEVAVKSYYRDAKDQINKELMNYLNPVALEEGQRQWEFGNTVYRADLYGQIDRLEFVKEIKSLTITASGGEYRKNQNGDIEIPPYGLIYLKSIHIDITNNEY